MSCLTELLFLSFLFTTFHFFLFFSLPVTSLLLIFCSAWQPGCRIKDDEKSPSSANVLYITLLGASLLANALCVARCPSVCRSVCHIFKSASLPWELKIKTRHNVIVNVDAYGRVDDDVIVSAPAVGQSGSRISVTWLGWILLPVSGMSSNFCNVESHASHFHPHAKHCRMKIKSTRMSMCQLTTFPEEVPGC